ncbi:MAG: ATP-binding cassette domain-containing protein [Proteobacteria bacterium]|nr:MAG: ATP-binding cassette domain-containing protein [Pseudomonadota bacterium]
MDADTVIFCKNVDVEFNYSNFEYSTLKELVFQRLQGKRQVTRLRALKSVDLEVKRGESVALIGHNGSGKSTLLKVLAGIIVPKKGSTVKTVGRVAPMIELGTGFDGELSGLENIYLSCAIMGLAKREVDAKLADIIAFSELNEFIHMPVKNYSSGMQARLGFACTTAVDPDILLVDEVLAVGDSNFAKKCLERVKSLRANGTTIVLVSHDPHVIKAFCDRGYVFDSGDLKFSGDVTEALQKHEDLMDERRLKALSAIERAEVERRKKLEVEKNLRSDGRSTPIPEVIASLHFDQTGKSDESIDLAKAFQIRFDLVTKNAEQFGTDITVGIAIYTELGSRIGGTNNLEKSFEMTKDELGKKHSSVSFVFSEGIPFILAGNYRLILGIHDNHLTRTVLYHDFGFHNFVNSSQAFNADRDLIRLDAVLSGIEVN